MKFTAKIYKFIAQALVKLEVISRKYKSEEQIRLARFKKHRIEKKT